MGCALRTSADRARRTPSRPAPPRPSRHPRSSLGCTCLAGGPSTGRRASSPRSTGRCPRAGLRSPGRALGQLPVLTRHFFDRNRIGNSHHRFFMQGLIAFFSHFLPRGGSRRVESNVVKASTNSSKILGQIFKGKQAGSGRSSYFLSCHDGYNYGEKQASRARGGLSLHRRRISSAVLTSPESRDHAIRLIQWVWPSRRPRREQRADASDPHCADFVFSTSKSRVALGGGLRQERQSPRGATSGCPRRPFTRPA